MQFYRDELWYQQKTFRDNGMYMKNVVTLTDHETFNTALPILVEKDKHSVKNSSNDCGKTSMNEKITQKNILSERSNMDVRK